MMCMRLGCLLAGAAVILGTSRASAQSQRAAPNIVVIVADDLGYGELGCQGNPEIPTPHIDALARDGVRFTSGYVTAPFCAASRAGLLTGRYQTRFGFEFNPIGAQNADPAIGLPADTVTFAERLHDAGYATGLVGKWHQGGTAAYHPQRRGFDEFFGFLHEGHYYVPPGSHDVTTWLRRKTLPDGGEGRWTSGDGTLTLSTHMRHDEPPYDADNPLLRGSQPTAEPDYLTNVLTREAVDFIQRHGERPFCLYVAYSAVHSPMQAQTGDLSQFSGIADVQRRIFAGLLHRLDQGVGQILQALGSAGVAERTLVWFISDNGGPTRELTSSNAPLRGGKGELYEGGVRVPFLLRWPGVAPAGVAEARAVSSLDIAATSLAAAGIVPALGDLDGVDLRPWLTGQRQDRPHPTLYWRVGDKAALRQDDWKLVRHSVRGAATWELYDLAGDAAETQNLAPRESERLTELIRRWEALNAEMRPPLWGAK